MTKRVDLEMTDTLHEYLRNAASAAGFKSLRGYIIHELAHHVGLAPTSPAWGGWKGNDNSLIPLYTKMAARMKDDPDYLASLMEQLRGDIDWSAMHKVCEVSVSEQRNIMALALCRVPRNDDEVRSVAAHAYPDDIEHGAEVVKLLLWKARIDWLLNSF